MILISGATGLIGGHTARILAENGNPIRIMSRTANPNVRKSDFPDAQLVVADFDAPDTLPDALDGVDTLLLVSPSNPSMVRQQCNLVAAAKAKADAGEPIRLVKVSGFLTALDSSSQSGRWHATIEAKINEARLAMTSLRPPFFMQNLLRLRASAESEGVIRTSMANAKVAMVDARDIAAVAAQCLLDAKYAGKALVVTGPKAIGFDEVAEELSAAIGRPVRHDTMSKSDEAARLELANTPRWRIQVLGEFNAGFARGLGAPVTDVVSTVTGRPPRTLHQFITDHVAT
ncbi:MAG: NmrA family NAD(P)-binding protein [Chromatiales bacterium]|jgi:uncharacterized protein YbjT (DUF2867 family)|nr:NmrA family NAD(P)-binding protein [Chromatiales bacterium]